MIKEHVIQALKMSIIVNEVSGTVYSFLYMQEENNNLMVMNEDLMCKLRRSEILLNRVNEELARYRTADGKTPNLDLDEEQRLRTKLKVCIAERQEH